jgi:hypothetical protein
LIHSKAEVRPTLDHSIRIEVISYDKDVNRWNATDNPDDSSMFTNQPVEFYRFLCSYSEQLHVLQFQEQLLELESKLSLLESHVHEFCASDRSKRSWLPALMLMIGQLCNPTLQLMHTLIPLSWLRMQLFALPARLVQIVRLLFRLYRP